MSNQIRINGGVIVKFTNLELWAMWELAKKRQAIKQGTNAKDRRYDTKRPNNEVHYPGIKGEYGFSSFVQIAMDLTVLKDGDSKRDFIYRDTNIEVKTLQGPDLVLDPGVLEADVILLVNPQKESTLLVEATKDKRITYRPDLWGWNNVVLLGWLWRDEFYNTCTRGDYRGLGRRDFIINAPKILHDIYKIFHI